MKAKTKTSPKNKIEVNKSKENLKVKSKNLGEGTKPLLQLKAHNDGNKPLLASRVCKGWAARDSPLLVAPCVALPLCLSPPPFVVHVHFRSSTHTKLKTPTKTKEKWKK
jgi:hypothetical protein